jgi:DNA-binding transcriptional ArsR family regulator
MRRDVFQAIADPTRRQIIYLIAGKSMNLNSIAENFNMSRPAISQHMKILSECGIVEIRSAGRERLCIARTETLREVHSWTEQFKVFWTKKLDDLGEFLDHETKQLTSAKKKNQSKRR